MSKHRDAFVKSFLRPGPAVEGSLDRDEVEIATSLVGAM
jgi:hypothetical protein